MIGLVLVAFMAVLGLLIMMGRLNLRRFLGYPNIVDITCTIIFAILFAGTFSGMVVAGFASLFLSLMLWVLRASIGAERLALYWGDNHERRIPRIYWKRIDPKDCQPHWLASMFKGTRK